MIQIIVMHMSMNILILTLRIIFIVRVVTKSSLLDDMDRHVDMYFLMHLFVLFILVFMLIILFRLLVLVLLSLFMLGLFIFFRVCRDAICVAV